MRVSQKDVPFKVATAPNTPHSIRLRLAGLTFGLTPGEAIRLANELADAIEAIERNERTQSYE